MESREISHSHNLVVYNVHGDNLIPKVKFLGIQVTVASKIIALLDLANSSSRMSKHIN